MAKVGVRIEGSETLSPAAASAAKSLRALREETESLKKGAQNVLQPLINLRSMIMGVGASAGIINALRAINSEIKASIKAYADQDAEFKARLDNVKTLGNELRAAIGEKLAPAVSALATAFGNVAQRILDVKNNAELAAKAIRDLQTGAALGERYMAAQGPDAAYFGVPVDLLKNAMTGIEQVYDNVVGNTTIAMTWAEMARVWGEVSKIVTKYGLEQTGLGKTLEWLRAQLWAPEPKDARSNLADYLRGDREATEDVASAVSDLADFFRADRGDTRVPTSGGAGSNLADALRADRGDTRVPSDGGGGEGALAGIMGSLGAAFANMLMSITSIQLLMDPIGTALQATLEIIGPLIDSALAPLVGILVVLGQLIGTLLVPVINILTPVIEAVANAFVWLYNNIIRPVGVIIYKIFSGLGGVLSVIVNAVIDVLNTFRSKNKQLAHWDYVPGNAEEALPEISYGDLLTAGGTAITNAGGGSYSSGSRTTVEYQPDIHLYLTIVGSVYGAGGPKKVGEEMARALEAYAGIGGRIHIEGALT